MDDEPFLLDVNVAMYAAGREHRYRESCAWVMSEIAGGRLAAAIDAETVQEVLHRFGGTPHHRLGISLARDLLAIVPTVLAVTAADAALAIDVLERYTAHGLRSRDAIRVAVMRNNGITRIVSTDRHFDHVEAVTRLDPADLRARAKSGTP